MAFYRLHYKITELPGFIQTIKSMDEVELSHYAPTEYFLRKFHGLLFQLIDEYHLGQEIRLH